MQDLNWIIDASRTLAELQAEATLRSIPTAGLRKEALRQKVAAEEMARTPVATTGTGAPPVTTTPPSPPVAPLTIKTTTLRNGRRGDSYNEQLLALGGSGRKRWSVTALPKGLRMNSVSGKITGKPREDGTFYPQVTVDDDRGTTPPTTLELVIRSKPERDRSFSFPDMSGVITFLAWGVIAVVALTILLIFGPPLVNWTENRIHAFREDNPGLVSNNITGTKNGNGDGQKAGTSNGSGGGTPTIGGLEINNDGKYNNGVSVGEIRPDVPAGYLVIGDATVNGRAPDSDSTTGLITVLFKPATVIGTNESSFQKLGNTSWQQAVKVKATEMRGSGCMGGCATVIVVDQDGNRLNY